MSAIIKGVRKSPAPPTSRRASTTSKNRTGAGKSASRPAAIAKRTSSDKAPARKATKVAASSKNKSAKKSAAKKTSARKSAPAKSTTLKNKIAAKKPSQAKQTKKSAPKSRAIKPSKKTPLRQSVPVTQPRHPTVDEAAALRAFERAHKEFVRGRFADARAQFRALLDKHSAVSEVAARARTYLNIAEARLRTESSLPRDADSLYDRGVIELNRGDYVAAQELFERALKREPEAAHVHYGLAASRARLGSFVPALESLQRALELQPSLRIRAQHDQDLTVLRSDPEFDRLIFSPRV